MKNPAINTLIKALRSETSVGAITPEVLGSLLQRIVEAVPEEGAISCSGKGSIFASTENDQLYLRGNIKQLLNDGYQPYLFRYSSKRNRHTIKETRERVYGPVHKGWNRCFKGPKIIVSETGKVKFCIHDASGSLYTSSYQTYPSWLIGPYVLEEDGGRCVSLRIPFGRKMRESKRGRRFTYAIGFAPEQKADKFDYSSLVTTLAVFHLFVCYNWETNKVEFHFSI